METEERSTLDSSQCKVIMAGSQQILRLTAHAVDLEALKPEGEAKEENKGKFSLSFFVLMIQTIIEDFVKMMAKEGREDVIRLAILDALINQLDKKGETKNV